MKDLYAKCPICCSLEFSDILYEPKSISTDLVEHTTALEKIECAKCGTVRTKYLDFLDRFYEEEYSFSTSDNKAMCVQDGQITTLDLVYYEWIKSLLNRDEKEFDSVLEIGCGNGNLIANFNIKGKFGIEPNISSHLLALRHCECYAVDFDSFETDRKFDLILAITVIEHIRNPKAMLLKLKDLLSANGKVVLILPVQDSYNHDVFFSDHIFHVHHCNFATMVQNCGLEIENYSLGFKSFEMLGCYVLTRGESCEYGDFTFQKNVNIKKTLSIFENINALTRQLKDGFYVFSYGERCKLVKTYTLLDRFVKLYIDDSVLDCDRVVSSEKAKTILQNGDTLLLLNNPKYNEYIKMLFADKCLTFIEPYNLGD